MTSKPVRESRIENYLHREVVKAGGTTRKFKGRINDPDRLVIWPPRIGIAYEDAHIHFVECKRPGKKARRAQAREHERLRAFGCCVFVLSTKVEVWQYVKENA